MKAHVALALAASLTVVLAPNVTAQGAFGSLAPASSSLGSSDQPTSRIDFDFARDPYAANPLPPESHPYARTVPIRLEPTGVFDEQKVSMYQRGGIVYDHPVRQAQYMLTRLNTYLLNQDERYLERSVRHAERILSYAERTENGTFMPYQFGFDVHGRDPIAAPWYSGMAQGQVMSAFILLYNETGEARYLDFATELFQSFLHHKDDSGDPWVTRVDDTGHLWFEEYAKDDYADFTYNGHIFATFGLYDYYLATGDQDALALFQGGVTTIRHYVDEIRNPGEISSYCLHHPDVKSRTYHNVHIRELKALSRLTGDPVFEAYSALLLQDFDPATDVAATAAVVDLLAE